MDFSLLNKFLSNDCSDLEKQEVEAWLLNPNNDAIIRKWMAEHWDSAEAENTSTENLNYTRIRSLIQARIELIKKSDRKTTAKIKILSFIKNNNPFRYAAVAAIIFSFLTNLYFLLDKSRSAEKGITGIEKRVAPSDIAPPKSTNALLKLANGKKIQLDSVGKGVLATEGEVKVTKNELGEIIYSGTTKNSISYNTMSLPKGSKPMRLILADGSLVWLNAASSVTFPTAFIGSERKVSITGEAYFEVIHNSAMPFYVINNDVMVKVLGTHFNVNTYKDEGNIKVTLLEGSVNVSNGNASARLKPGNQAIISKDNILVAPSIDIDEVMAWKNGQFYYKGTELKSIMRQIEKYYNVEVEFKDDLNYEFYAKVDRNINVSEFLKKLELTNLVHFKIEANKITVMK